MTTGPRLFPAIAVLLALAGCGGDAPAPTPTVQVAAPPPPPQSLRPPGPASAEARAAAIERVREQAAKKYPNQLLLDDLQATWMDRDVTADAAAGVEAAPGAPLTREQREAIATGKGADGAALAPPPPMARPRTPGSEQAQGVWRVKVRLAKPAQTDPELPPLIARVFDVGSDGRVVEQQGLHAPREALGLPREAATAP